MELIRQRDLQDESGPVELPVGPTHERGWRPVVPIGPPAARARRPPPPAAPACARPRGRTALRRRARWPRKRIGELLLELKRGDARASRPRWSSRRSPRRRPKAGRLGEILVKMRAVTEEEVLQALGEAAGDRLQRRPEGRRRRHRSGHRHPDRLRQAAPAAGRQARGRRGDGGDGRSAGRGRARRSARCSSAPRCSRCWCRRSEILEVINDVYGRKQDKGGDLGEKANEEDDEGASEELVDILEITDEAPIIRWVNSLLFNAVKERASDIHIEPGEKEVHGPLPHRRRALRDRARRPGSSCPRSSRA